MPDSGAEDVGGSKAQRGAGTSAVAIEAELSALQSSMLSSWQAAPPGAQQQPSPPLRLQVPGWQGQLDSLEARATVRYF